MITKSRIPESLKWLNLDESIGALRTRDEENHDIVAAFSRIPSTPWMLVSEDDWEILAGSTLKYGRLLLGNTGSWNHTSRPGRGSIDATSKYGYIPKAALKR